MILTLFPCNLIIWEIPTGGNVRRSERIIFNCEFCGKEVSQIERVYNLARHHYCSHKCKSEALKKDKIEVMCEACGKSKLIRQKEYEDSKRKRFFCNRSCQLNFYAENPQNNPNYKGGEFRKCAFCGEVEIYVKNSKKNQRNFCSKECADKFLVGENASAWNGGKIKRICKQCGSDFYVVRAEAERNKALYCSMKCLGISRRKRIIVECYNCNTKFEKRECEIVDGKRIFCSRECVHMSISGENNINWAGGEESAFYDDYAHRLEPIEEIRRYPKDNRILQTKCTYCGSWMIPAKDEVGRRISYIEGRWKENCGEPRFYCRDTNCRENCPIFGQRFYTKGYSISTSREVQPELRQLCFARDNYKCIICSTGYDLHCHHLEGIKYNPIESADLDLVVTVCAKHHKQIHSQKGCKYSDLQCKEF